MVKQGIASVKGLQSMYVKSSNFFHQGRVTLNFLTYYDRDMDVGCALLVENGNYV